MTMLNKQINDFIERSLEEDLGDGDHTTMACIPKNTLGEAKLIVKQEGIIAGMDIAQQIFLKLDPTITFDQKIKDGTSVHPGDIAFIVSGKVWVILQAERLVLNVMQRLSGIATQTQEYVKALDGFKTKILDTRKTTPGMRILDKMAVKTGGGFNHRMGLYDMILIKDNHIDYSGGIEQAVNRTIEYLARTKKNLKIEVEVRNLDDVKKVLTHKGISRVLLDNFTIAQTREAVNLINGQIETESSGGITIDNIRAYAECGVDYISVGALTHQIKSIDLSLKAI